MKKYLIFIKNLIKRHPIYNILVPYYDILIPYYHILKNPRSWKEDFLFRINKSPDGYPIPPVRLIYLVIGGGSPTVYYRSGEQVVSYMLELLNSAKIDVNNFSSILDFGCGCGRMIRHFKDFNVKLQGCDYNPMLVNWCRANLPFAQFFNNNLNPPTSCTDKSFDFIYLLSIFTHMNAPLQIRWLDELNRVLSDEGVLLFTTHGNHYTFCLSAEEMGSYKENNFATKNLKLQGTNHMASFESFEFVKENLLKHFELVSYVAGSDNFRQDTYIVRKKRLDCAGDSSVVSSK